MYTHVWTQVVAGRWHVSFWSPGARLRQAWSAALVRWRLHLVCAQRVRAVRRRRAWSLVRGLWALWNVAVDMGHEARRLQAVERSLEECRGELADTRKAWSTRNSTMQAEYVQQLQNVEKELAQQLKDNETIEARNAALELEMQKWTGRASGGTGLAVNRVKRALQLPAVAAKARRAKHEAEQALQPARTAHDEVQHALLHRYIAKAVGHEHEVKKLGRLCRRQQSREHDLFKALGMLLSRPTTRNAPEAALARRLVAHRPGVTDPKQVTRSPTRAGSYPNNIDDGQGEGEVYKSKYVCVCVCMYVCMYR